MTNSRILLVRFLARFAGIIATVSIANGQECGFFTSPFGSGPADRAVIAENWTGFLVDSDPLATKSFAEGDCDGDRDVDSLDMLGTWAAASDHAEGGPGDHRLLYNHLTGTVVLDPRQNTSGTMIGFVLTTDNQFRTENTTLPFLDTGSNTDNISSANWPDRCPGTRKHGL